MAVLHLLGSPGEGGAETYFLHLLAALADDGLAQAAAIHANPSREAALAGLKIPVEVMPYDAPFDWTTGRRIRALAERLPAKVLLQWMNRAGRVVPRQGPWTRIGRLGGYYDLKYYKGCEMLVANTADIAAHIVNKGWPRERVLHIPNFAEADETLPVSRASLDTPEGVPLMLAMGRLHPVKAHDVALRTLPLLPDAWLWIAGEGPLEAKLKALAARLGVADRVRFLGWRRDAGALYRTADLCLFPSRYEPLGNTVIQAWAHGAPVVAAASQGPSVLITPEVDGLLAPIDDVAALASAAGRVLADPSLRARLVEGGYQRVRGEFAKAPVIARWRELFSRYGEG
jgi:glycosyltransferase involved in cell wall biosynthesis